MSPAYRYIYFSDIFSADINKQVAVTKIFSCIEEWIPVLNLHILGLPRGLLVRAV